MSSSFALICWEDKVLLFHRDNIPTIPHPDCWHLPGGGLEIKETPLEGLKRELMEEVSFVPSNINFLAKVKGIRGHTHMYISFTSDDEARQFKHGEGEGQEIRFFTIKEALKLKLTPILKIGLTKFGNQLEKAMKEKSVPKGVFQNFSLLKTQ